MKKNMFRFGLPLLGIMLIIIIVLAIIITKQNKKLKEIENEHLYHFSSEVDETAYEMELGLENDFLLLAFNRLEKEFHHDITRFHNLSPSNHSLFDDISNYFLHSVKSIDEKKKLRMFLNSLSDEIKKISKGDKRISTNDINEFLQKYREKFDELFVK